jgi:hypothetical protein
MNSKIALVLVAVAGMMLGCQNSNPNGKTPPPPHMIMRPCAMCPAKALPWPRPAW